MKKVKGFTFIDMILSIAIFLAVGVTAGWLTVQFSAERKVSATRDIISFACRKAQEQTIAGKYASDFGVAYRDEKIVVFEGNEYSGRNEVHDEFFEVDESVEIQGFDEVVFRSPTGVTDGGVDFSLATGGIVWGYNLSKEGGVQRQ